MIVAEIMDKINCLYAESWYSIFAEGFDLLEWDLLEGNISYTKRLLLGELILDCLLPRICSLLEQGFQLCFILEILRYSVEH